ncbi:MAG: Sugar-non-specific nuclease NucA-like protein, partial [Gemmataceae bacterium]|nr:Sugar-non-specific nuclease NucA-like protein [Gemmataceae bacterium]
MDPKTIRTIVTVVVLALLLISFVVQVIREKENEQPPQEAPADTRPPDGVPPSPDDSPHLLMGNPSGATPDPALPDNYLLKKPYYALSYHNAKGTPNWVSWRLQESDLGPAPRSEFYPDPDLPSGFTRITPRDYTGSGFDRGHMCPRSDRTSTPEAAHSTFAMTNIVPQAPSVNQKAWADLEDYCRGLATKKHQTLYIVAGPQGKGGVGTKGPAETIGGGKVTVPAKCWKVLVAVDGGAGTPEDVNKVGPGTRAIAVVMPNDESVGHGWAKYRTSVKEVET